MFPTCSENERGGWIGDVEVGIASGRVDRFGVRDSAVRGELVRCVPFLQQIRRDHVGPNAVVGGAGDDCGTICRPVF